MALATRSSYELDCVDKRGAARDQSQLKSNGSSTDVVTAERTSYVGICRGHSSFMSYRLSETMVDERGGSILRYRQRQRQEQQQSCRIMKGDDRRQPSIIRYDTATRS